MCSPNYVLRPAKCLLCIIIAINILCIFAIAMKNIFFLQTFGAHFFNEFKKKMIFYVANLGHFDKI